MSVLNLYRDDGFVAEQVLMRASVSLGRHPENDIVLDDRTLSRFHARVERRGDRYVVIDLGAQNGVYLNGARITGESGLTPGDRIGLGRYVAIFDPQSADPRLPRAEDPGDDATNVLDEHVIGARDAEASTESPFSDDEDDDVLDIDIDEDTPAQAEPTQPSGDGGLLDAFEEDSLDVHVDDIEGNEDLFDEPTTALVGKKNRKEPAKVPIFVLLYNGMEVSRHPVRDELVVGRSKRCDIVISLLGLSRRHARLYREGERYLVDDMGSQNGTWVNNQRLEGPRPLHHGDLMNFYEYGLLFLEDPDAKLELAGETFATDLEHAGDDSLSGQDTGRRDAPTGPVASSVPTSRSPVPIVESDIASEPRERESGGFDFGDLGEGSFLDDEALAGEEVAEASVLDGSVEPQPTLATEVGDELDDLGSRPEEEIDEEVARAVADELGFSSRTEAMTAAGAAYDVDKTAYSLAPRLGDGEGRGAWPTDEELEQALAREGGQTSVTLEVYLDDDLYTQMPVAQPVTRIGTDARCELALPSAAGLARWQMTLVRFGRTCVLYRASANARVIIDDVAVDQAVLQSGDVIQLGRLRIVYQCR